MIRHTARDKNRRCIGYTIAKRRRLEFRKRVLSYSPPERVTVYRRIRVCESSDEESENEAMSMPEPRSSRKRMRNCDNWKRKLYKNEGQTSWAVLCE